MHVTGIAIVLLVILILIVGILFSPITYSVELSSRKPYRAALKVQWLGRVFRIHFAYESGKPFFKEVYILRQAKLGATRDYEEWLSRRVQEETADGFSDDIMDEAKSEKDANKAADAKVQQTASKPVEAAKPAERVRFDKDGTPLDAPKRVADETAAQSERAVMITHPLHREPFKLIPRIHVRPCQIVEFFLQSHLADYFLIIHVVIPPDLSYIFRSHRRALPDCKAASPEWTRSPSSA